MGRAGTATRQRLHQQGFEVIAGCGPSRDYAKWLDEQKAQGFTFHASVGNVADWDSTVEAFSRATAEHGTIDVLGEQRRHHARPHVPEDDAGRLEGRHRHQPQQHVQRHQAGGAGHGGKGLGPHHPDLLGQRREGPGRARPDIRPPRPACTASPWHWRRNSRARA
jgi:hypothetical protein